MMDNYDKNIEPVIRCSCKDKYTDNSISSCLCNYQDNNNSYHYDISSKLDDTTNKSYQLMCKARELEIKIKIFTNDAMGLNFEEEECRLKADQLHYEANIIWKNISNLEKEYNDLIVLANYYSSKSKESNLNQESFNKYNCKY